MPLRLPDAFEGAALVWVLALATETWPLTRGASTAFVALALIALLCAASVVEAARAGSADSSPATVSGAATSVTAAPPSAVVELSEPPLKTSMRNKLRYLVGFWTSPVALIPQTFRSCRSLYGRGSRLCIRDA